MPSFCACGAERSRNGSSSIDVGRSGLHESVHRSSPRLAPFSWESNHAPPSSANLPVSSATPQTSGGAAAPRAVVCAPAVPAITAVSAHANAHAAANLFIDALSLVRALDVPCPCRYRHRNLVPIGLPAHLSREVGLERWNRNERLCSTSVIPIPSLTLAEHGVDEAA